jgi:hypothetical protein
MTPGLRIKVLGATAAFVGVALGGTLMSSPFGWAGDREKEAVAGSPAETIVPTAAEQAGVIQSQETNLGGLMGEITECRRHEGVLTIKLRFRNTTNKRAQLRLTNYNSAGDNQKFYVTAGNKKFFMLKDTEGTYLTSNSNGSEAIVDLEAGQTFVWWGKYPAPPAEVKKINFTTPVAPPFEDVPISDK